MSTCVAENETMEFDLLSPGDRFESAELQERARDKDFSHPARCYYRVRDRAKELAYTQFDLDDHQHELVVYEIYVLPSHQSREIGSGVLDFAKDKARERGDRRVLVRPHSLSDPKRDVVPFYEKNGFSWAEDYPAREVMEFVLSI
jgi:GNAT superfamily N-acetyltransferase